MEIKKNKYEIWPIKSMTTNDSLIQKNCVDEIEVLGAAKRSDLFVASCIQNPSKIEDLLDSSALKSFKNPIWFSVQHLKEF